MTPLNSISLLTTNVWLKVETKQWCQCLLSLLFLSLSRVKEISVRVCTFAAASYDEITALPTQSLPLWHGRQSKGRKKRKREEQASCFRFLLSPPLGTPATQAKLVVAKLLPIWTIQWFRMSGIISGLMPSLTCIQDLFKNAKIPWTVEVPLEKKFVRSELFKVVKLISVVLKNYQWISRPCSKAWLVTAFFFFSSDFQRTPGERRNGEDGKNKERSIGESVRMRKNGKRRRRREKERKKKGDGKNKKRKKE